MSADEPRRYRPETLPALLGQTRTRTGCWPPERTDTDPPCIEIRTFVGTVKRFSVREYESDRARVDDFSNFWEYAVRWLLWTLDAPAVEELTTSWQKRSSCSFRISDWDTYVWQMHVFLGLR